MWYVWAFVVGMAVGAVLMEHCYEDDEWGIKR